MNKSNGDPYPWGLVFANSIDVVLFIILFGVGYVSYIASLNMLNGETDWFQRSGSIICLLSAIIEFRHFQIFKTNHVHISVMSGAMDDCKILSIMSKLRLFVGNNAIYFLIIGTVIWGYGDIPFNKT